MIAETVYPIVESLSLSEQRKLFEMLGQRLKSSRPATAPRVMTDKQKRKAEWQRWLKNNIFNSSI